MDRRTPTTPNQPARNRSRFSTQQTTILLIVGVLNVLLLLLGVVAWNLMRASQQTAQSVAPSAEQPPPPTWTPASPSTAQPAGVSQPSLPPDCNSRDHEVQRGTVTRVLDPSTLEVSVNGLALPVSFAGLLLPDPDRSLPAIQKMVEGQQVTLVKDVTEQDASGRLVRYVLAGDRFLNLELVQMGLARLQPDSPDRACAGLFQQAEQHARAGGVGIWKQTVVPTATFIPFVTLDPNGNDGCDCSVRYECGDFGTHDSAQACFNLCNDYSSKLDEDHDGLACENLP